MHRRSFFSGGITLFGSLAARAAVGQSFKPNRQRAAVVIGLDVTPELKGLQAAVSGAEEIAAFLDGEGFEVSLFTDRPDSVSHEPKLVRAYQIADQIESLVNRGTLDQLVVYFSGHGTMSGSSEFWLLSKAATQSSEAISVQDTRFHARLSGIPNVVLISDACRSVASSLNLTSVSGQSIFPSARGASNNVDVDTFYAALPGDPALEMLVEESVAQHEGIFTSAFLKAFREPDNDMIYTLENGLNVVPNRKLRKFLVREVQARAQARSIRLKQVPDAMVMSDLPTYIARASNQSPVHTVPISRVDQNNSVAAYASVGNAMSALIQHQVSLSDPVPYVDLPNRHLSDLPSWESQSGSRALVLRNTRDQNRDVSLPSTGIAVYGGEVAEILLGPDGNGDQPQRFSGISQRFSGQGWRPFGEAWQTPISEGEAISALITFGDGSGCAIALLKNFGLHITLDDAGVRDIRYSPTRESPLLFDFASAMGHTLYPPGESSSTDAPGGFLSWLFGGKSASSYLPSENTSPYQDSLATLFDPGSFATLRALVAEATRLGVLRFEGTAEERKAAAKRFAGQIRVGMAMDPTLGILAAYAYALGFLDDDALSVHDILKADVGAALFDTTLAAGMLWRDCEDLSSPVVPAAPMMRQGWELLRARGIKLPQAFEEARPALRDSLWTTFGRDGMKILSANATAVLEDAACRAQVLGVPRRPVLPSVRPLLLPNP